MGDFGKINSKNRQQHTKDTEFLAILFK